jgi:hypothetical protein
MKTPAVGIHAPTKGEVGAGVVAEDGFDGFFVNGGSDDWWRCQQFSYLCGKWIGRIGNLFHDCLKKSLIPLVLSI